jgi:hypothetical protein
MKKSIELLLNFSSFGIHNSSFSFTYPPAAGGKKIKILLHLCFISYINLDME